MKKSTLSLFFTTGILACTSMVHANASEAGTTASQTSSQVVTEFSGKPPFKRQRVVGETMDMAQFEVVTSAQTCQANKATMRGKPPFKRSSDCVETVDLAQFEVTNEEKTTQFSGRPPFKRH